MLSSRSSTGWLRRSSVLTSWSSSTRATTARPAPRLLAARRGLAEMPVPQSSKAVLFAGHPAREGWETTVYVWYAVSLVMMVAIFGFGPDTSIEAWAQAEAKARRQYLLEHPGETLEFGVHYQNLEQDRQLDVWDRFSSKAVRMNDDDDDEDEEEEGEAEEEDDDE